MEDHKLYDDDDLFDVGSEEEFLEHVGVPAVDSHVPRSWTRTRHGVVGHVQLGYGGLRSPDGVGGRVHKPCGPLRGGEECRCRYAIYLLGVAPRVGLFLDYRSAVRVLAGCADRHFQARHSGGFGGSYGHF